MISSVIRKETPVKIDQVAPAGILAARLRLSMNKLIRDREMHTKHVNWGADQIGRWIGAVLAESVILGETENMPIIQDKVSELMAAQDMNGLYYGADVVDDSDWEALRRVWFGHGRGIWHVLEYCEVTGDPKAMESLCGAADCAAESKDWWVISKPLCGGIESSVGPMARLGERTGRREYVDYARYITENIQHRVAKPSAQPTAHVHSTNLHTHEEKPFYHHTHSHLNTTHGMVDLAIVTGEQRYIDQAMRIWEESFPSVWMDGGFPESYGDYYERCDETCPTVDWLMLNLKLLAITGDAKYLDCVELSAMNHLLFSQDREGNFTTYRSINRHHWMDKHNWGGPQTECCCMAGGWGLAQLAMHTVTSNTDGISINLALDVDVAVPVAGGLLSVSQKVATGKHELAQDIVITNDGDRDMTVRVRIPYWCADYRMSIDGVASTTEPVDSFVQFECASGQSLDVKIILPMTLVVIPPRANALMTESAAGDAPEVGLQYGPYVLMFNREMYPDIEGKDIRLVVPVDMEGRPTISQKLPDAWDGTQAIPLLVQARLGSKHDVWLTPCANLTLTDLTVHDPYVLRFAEARLDRSSAH